MTHSPVRVIQPKPDPRLVEQLEGLLEMAKSGHITGFAAITIHIDNCIGESYGGSTGKNIYRTIGALDCLKARLITHISEAEQ